MTPDMCQRLDTARPSPKVRVLIVGVGLLLLSLSLAACSPASAAGSTNAAGAPNAGGQHSRPQQCGEITVAGGRTVAISTAQAENCFWEAFQHCQPASLTVTMMGVDAGTLHTFTLAPKGSACVLTDQQQTYVVPGKRSPTHTYTCTSLAQQQGGLRFQSCGADGDVYVPAPAN